MRIRAAVVSDIHTNRAAWDATLVDIESQSVEAIWALGDWVGYGSGMLTSLLDQIMKDDRILSVKGNHDIAILCNKAELASFRRQWSFNDDAWRVIERQRLEVEFDESWRSRQREWLESLPYVIIHRPGVVMSHGVPLMSDIGKIPFLYTGWDCSFEDAFRSLHNDATDDRIVEELAELGDIRLIMTGHTHSQGVWQREPRGQRVARWRRLDQYDSMIELANKWKAGSDVPTHCEEMSASEGALWLSPGSVGCPRFDGPQRTEDGFTWSKYAVIDISATALTVCTRWVPYTK